MNFKKKTYIGLGVVLIIIGGYFAYREFSEQNLDLTTSAKKNITLGVPRKMSLKAKIQEAKKLMDDAQFAKASILLSSVLKKDINQIEPYQLLGEIYVQTKNFAKLDNLIEQVEKKFPENSLINDLKIKKLILNKKFNDVLSAINKAENVSNDLKYYQAVLLSLQNNHEKSREILDNLSKLPVKNSSDSNDESTREEDSISEELLKKVRGFLNVYNEFDKFADGKNPHLFALLSKNLAENNEAVLAKEFASVAIKEDPEYVDGWVLRGYAEYLMEDYANSLEDLRQAYDLDPSRPEVYYFLALALEKSGNLHEAALFFEKSLEFDFEFSREIRWKLIDILIDEKKYDKVIELYKDLAQNSSPEERKKFISATANLINILQDPKAALEITKILNENNPDDVLSLNLKAWALLENNNLEEAEIVLNKALSLNEENPRTALNLGVMYEKYGDLSQARKWYKKSYEYGLGRGFDDIVNLAADKFNKLIDREDTTDISPNDKRTPNSP